LFIRHIGDLTKRQIGNFITGQGGSGKSFVIECLKRLLQNCVIVCSCFGLAAYDIGGQTLHSLFHLPILGRHHNDLKGKSLQKLQIKLMGVKYIIIDEFSVIAQKMLGWVGKRCRQDTCQMEALFGSLSVILVGDINQLPLVSDSVLYHKKPTSDVRLQGLYVYKEFNLVVRLVQNVRAAGNNESLFRTLLSNVREGKSTASRPAA